MEPERLEISTRWYERNDFMQILSDPEADDKQVVVDRNRLLVLCGLLGASIGLNILLGLLGVVWIVKNLW